jgi:peptidoglycan/LPS O-acetylase OafA/YrhL
MTSSSGPALTLSVPVSVDGRLSALDELKGIAIILVLLYHAGGVLGWSNYLHGDLGVDVFVILSGVGLAWGRSWRNTGSFFRRRLVRIMPTYWIVLTVFLLLNTYFLQHNYSSFNIFTHYLGIHGWFGDLYALSIVDSFWFITLILSFYLLFPWLRHLIDRPDQLLLTGAALSIVTSFTWFFTEQSGSFGHLGLRIPGFFYGLLIGRLIQRGNIRLPLGATLVLAVLLITYIPYTQGIIFHTGIVALALMCIYTFGIRSLIGPRSRKTLKFLGDHSLEIFLIHQPLIRDYNFYLHGRWLNEPTPTSASLILGMAIGVSLTLIISVELHRLLNRILPS